MENYLYSTKYICQREKYFILEGRYYCKEEKTPDTRCNKQCDSCRKVVDEKINLK